MSVIINSCAPGCWTCYPSKEHSKSCFLNWKPHEIESSFGVWKFLQMISSHAFHRTHTPWKPRIITGRSESELYITGTSNIRVGWWYLHSNIICCTPDSCTMDLHNQHPQIYQLFDQELLSPKTQAHHFEGPKISKLLCLTILYSLPPECRKLQVVCKKKCWEKCCVSKSFLSPGYTTPTPSSVYTQ